MARALVIGGTLFIGRTLVEQLLARGDDVTILHRGAGTPFGDRVREFRSDRNDATAMERVLAGQQFDVAYDNVYDWQRGTPAEPVVAAARVLFEGGLARYVFTSSVAAYGGGGAFDEDDALASPEERNDYSRQKAESERALFALQREAGGSVATLRPAFIYGRYNPFDREAFFWDRIRDDRPIIIPEDGLATMQWVKADDVARAAILAGEREAAHGRAYNLANWPPVTQVEFVQMLARAAGREARLVHVPRAQIREAGGRAHAPPLYFGEYLDIPPLSVRVERVRTELGLELTPLEEGLRETYGWYEQQSRSRPDYSWEDALLAQQR